MRNTDIVYFKQEYDNIAGVMYQVEIIPGFPHPGPRGNSIVREELGNVISIDTTLEGSFESLPFGIIDTPAIKAKIDLHNCSANFKKIIKLPTPTATEFPGDDRFNRWYSQFVSTTWIISQKKSGENSWTTKFIGVQKPDIGYKLREKISPYSNNLLIEQIEIEIISVGAYLLQSVSRKNLCDTIIEAYTPFVKNFYVDVLQYNNNNTGIAGAIGINQMKPVSGSSVEQFPTYHFYKLSQFATAYQLRAGELYRALLRDTQPTVLCDDPHAGWSFKDPFGSNVEDDELYFIGAVKGRYYEKNNNGEIISISNATLGGLLVDEKTIVDYSPRPPRVFIENFESLADYDNCFDLFKDLSENFYKKLTWRFVGKEIRYQFTFPNAQTHGWVKPVLSKSLAVSTTQESVEIEKSIAYKALRAVEVNIDNPHVRELGDDKWISRNEKMIKSQSKLEIKAIFHNLPDIPTRDEYIMIVEEDFNTGRDFIGYVSNSRPLCSKLFALSNAHQSKTDLTQQVLYFRDSTITQTASISLAGIVPYAVTTACSFNNVVNEASETLSAWSQYEKQTDYARYAGDLLEAQRESALPYSLTIAGIRDFSNAYQVYTEISVPSSTSKIDINSIGDRFTFDEFDTELDEMISLTDSIITSLKESIKDNKTEISLFIFSK